MSKDSTLSLSLLSAKHLLLFFFFFFLLLLTQAVICEEASSDDSVKQPLTPEEEGKAKAKAAAAFTELTDATFKDFLKSSEYCVILFYEDWCPNCKDFMPVFEEVAKSVGDKVPVARIQLSENRAAAVDEGIKSFPNLRIYIKEAGVEYLGERTYDKIVKFIEKGKNPSYTELNTPEEAAEFVASHPLSVLACNENAKTTKFKALFERISEEMYLSTEISFAWGSSASVIGAAESPALVMRRPDSGAPEEFKFENGAKGLRTWIARRAAEPIEEITAGNFGKYVIIDLPVAWIVTPGEVDPALLASLRAVALEFFDRVAFVWLNDAKYPGQTRHLGVNYREARPTMVISTEERRYVLPRARAGKEAFTAEVVREFVKEFLDGKITPSVRSLEAPSKEENAKRDVKIAVASNFGDLVRDSTKDVIVNFYAPWCGHCQALAPVYEEAAKMLRNVGSVVFAEMDATENDLPKDVEITGYPTMYLFPANTNLEPVKYEDDRSVSGIIKFIQNYATIAFDVKPDVEEFVRQEEDFVSERIIDLNKESEDARNEMGVAEEKGEEKEGEEREGKGEEVKEEAVAAAEGATMEENKESEANIDEDKTKEEL